MTSQFGRLAGPVAIFDWSRTGIGRATALKLASEGTDLAINDIDNGPPEIVADEVRALGRRVTVMASDITGADFGELFSRP